MCLGNLFADDHDDHDHHHNNSEEGDDLPIRKLHYRHVLKCPIYYPIFQKSKSTKKRSGLDDVAAEEPIGLDQDSQPRAVFAHTTQFIPELSLIYSWGGRNNPSVAFQRYDTKQKKWIKSEGGESDSSGKLPQESLHYHSLNYVSCNHSLYIIGGITDSSSTESSVDMYRYSLKDKKWSTFSFPTNGKAPETGLYGHVCVYRTVDHSLVIFGGFTRYWKSDDLFVFDCVSGKWKNVIKPRNIFPSRSFSTAVYNETNDTMIVYAGEINSDVPKLTCELGIFHFKTQTWEVVEFEHWNYGANPEPIYGHTLCLLNDRFLLSHGGCAQNDRIPRSDCFVFDLCRCEWSICPELGEQAGCLLCSTLSHEPKSHSLYFYGGNSSQDHQGSVSDIVYVSYRFSEGDFFFMEKLHTALNQNQLSDIKVYAIGNSLDDY